MGDSITGRDSYLMRKALMYAIGVIDRLPLKEQDASDRDDMKEVLDALVRPEDDNWRQHEQRNIARKLDTLTSH